MHRIALLISLLSTLALTACGEESSVGAANQQESATASRLFVQAEGMVKALGIT